VEVSTGVRNYILNKKTSAQCTDVFSTIDPSY